MEDLEEISDTTTENGKDQDIVVSDDEPEEGEISDDEITVERVVKPSEVVIYDDHGRTAIFTSPKKNDDNWDSGVMQHYSNYCSIQESVRRDSCSRKRKSYKDMISKEKRSGKKSITNHTKHKSRNKLKASMEKENRSKRRSPSSSSESVYSSSSSCSCSCSTSSYSSDVRVISPPRNRGKENKKVSQVERRQESGVSHSHFQSYLEEQYHRHDVKVKKPSDHSATISESDYSSPRKLPRPHSPSHRKEVTAHSPPMYGHIKHTEPNRNPVRSVRPPSRNLKTPPKSTNSRSKSRTKDRVRKRSMNRKSSVATKRKESHSFQEDEIDLNLVDKNALPPPGSLGEMLLRKTQKGKLKVSSNSSLPITKDSAKEITRPSVEKSVSINPPVINVDDDDDVEKANKALKDIITVGLDEEDDDELQLRLNALKSSLKYLSDARNESRAAQLINLDTNDGDTPNSSTVSDTEYPTFSGKAFSPSSLEGSLLECIFKRDAAGEFGESREKPRGTIVKETVSSKWRQDTRENVKDLPDSNQDIIDMEICDSSPEEDNFEDFVDVLKEVGEDITLDDDILSGHTDETHTRDGCQQNFQIPVEWAYMMPPPPPPDQPDNDIVNIDSWCYDQNMYLQSMQSTPSGSNEQVPLYDSILHEEVKWDPNAEVEAGVRSYDCLEEQAGEPKEKVKSIFGHNQSLEIEPDLTSNLLNLPKASDNSDNRCEDAAPNSFSQESLKDQAAHKYQAFMNAVLQKHSSQGHISSANRDRNLLEVNLLKPHSKKLTNDFPEMSPQNIKKIISNGRTLIKVSTDTKINDSGVSRATAKKRRKKRWKKMAKQKLKAKEILLVNQTSVAFNDACIGEVEGKLSSSHPEEEDEDLLRAQLLIDLSKKKMQKEENLVSSNLGMSTSGAEGVRPSSSASLSGSIGKKLDQHGNSSPCSVPSSGESSPKIRPMSGYSLSRKIALQRTTGKEGSPTHTLRLEPRHLSDIGGYGLDPKHSRYDYPLSYDVNLRKDFPKIKFPPIKPVIINVGASSSDEEEEEQVLESKAGCSKADDSVGRSSGGGNKEPSFSSNLDSLLKSMRAKTAVGSSNSKANQTAAVNKQSKQTSTPLAVRHLSRTKQEEYHRLKKQLLEKEKRLHLERQQQLKKTSVSKQSKEAELVTDSIVNADQVGTSSQLQNSSVGSEKSPKIEVNSKSLDGESCKERAVSLHEMGMIKVQLSNTTCTEDTHEKSSVMSVEELNQPVDDRSASVSDEDDEEALRLMVLKSIPKKMPQKALGEKVEKDSSDKSESTNSQNIVSEKGLNESDEDIHDKPGSGVVQQSNTRKRSSEFFNDSSHAVKVMKAEAKVVSKQGCNDRKVDCEKGMVGKSILEASKPSIPESSIFDKALSSNVGVEDANRKGLPSLKDDKKPSNSNKTTVQGNEKMEKPSNSNKAAQRSEKMENRTNSSKTIQGNDKVVKPSTSAKSVVQGNEKIEKPTSSNKAILQGNENMEKPSNSDKGIIQKNEKVDEWTNSKKAIFQRNERMEKPANCANAIAPGSDKMETPTSSSRTIVQGNEKIEKPSNSNKTIVQRNEKMEKTSDSNRTTVQVNEKQEMWNHLKREYIKKRLHTNKVIEQLTLLVQQAAEEEEKRKSIKDSIVKLQSQLAAKEAQFEAQSRIVKNKMENIRKLQYQMTEDCQVIKDLEVKGEALGKEVNDTDSLPRIFSKSKQTLANSLSELRQQMRDVCNKSKANLQAAAASRLQGKVKDSTGGAGVGNPKTSFKTSLQGVSSTQASIKNSTSSIATVKRKATSSVGPPEKKLLKSKIVAKQLLHLEDDARNDLVEGMLGNKEADDRSSVIVGRKKLDEMNELCPYDLLGRCNDDSCIYQHLAQPKVERLPCVELPSSSNIQGTGQSVVGNKGDPHQNISLEDKSSNDSSPKIPTISKSTSKSQMDEANQTVESAVSNENLDLKKYQEENISFDEKSGGTPLVKGKGDNGKILLTDKSVDLENKAEDSSQNFSFTAHSEVSEKIIDTQEQIAACDGTSSIKACLIGSNPVEANLYDTSFLPSFKVSESHDKAGDSGNTDTEMENRLVKHSCEVQNDSVSSNIGDDSAAVIGTFYSEKMLGSESKSTNADMLILEVLERKDLGLELEQKEGSGDVCYLSVKGRNSEEKRYASNSYSPVGENHNTHEEGCQLENSSTMSGDNSITYQGGIKNEELDHKRVHKYLIHEVTEDAGGSGHKVLEGNEKYNIDEDVVLEKQTNIGDPADVNEGNKGSEKAIDNNAEVHEDPEHEKQCIEDTDEVCKKLKNSKEDAQLSEDTMVKTCKNNSEKVSEDYVKGPIDDSVGEQKLMSRCDELLDARHEPSHTSNGESTRPKILKGGSVEFDKSQCNKIDQTLPTVTCNEGDILCSKVDLSSVDEEEHNSEVRQRQNTRGRKTRRRQHRPSPANSACRRGRSRNSSSSSSTPVCGVATKGKSRGGKKVSTRTRTARGRPPGGRRGAR